MTAEEAWQFVESLFQSQGHSLSDLQRDVFYGFWAGESYQEIHRNRCRDRITLKYLEQDLAHTFLKRLRDVLQDPLVRKNNVKTRVRAAYERQILPPDSPPDPPTADADHPPPALQAQPSEASLPSPHGPPLTAYRIRQIYWGLAPEVKALLGRDRPIESLKHNIHVKGCRLVFFYGLPKVGKTAIAVRLGEEVQSDFEFVYWHSADERDDLPTLTGDLVNRLSNQQDRRQELAVLVDHLKNRRCLLVLDGVHCWDGAPLKHEFGAWLRQISEVAHHSCLIVTGREVPQALLDLQRYQSEAVQVCELQGLDHDASQQLLRDRYRLLGSPSHWRQLIRGCEGNPHLLDTVGEQIQEIYEGDVGIFLRSQALELHKVTKIRQWCQSCLRGLTEQEKALIKWLANATEPIGVADLIQALSDSQAEVDWAEVDWAEVDWAEVVRSLRRKTLIILEANHCRLPPVISISVLTRNSL